MRSVAIVGGGPAGAYAAEKLARAGLEVTLLDEKLAWEKPCGGGLTYKAYQQYPFLLENRTPKHTVRKTCLTAPSAGTAQLTLTRPILIYSRQELNGLLLDRAAQAGAAVEKTRVTRLERRGRRWRLHTRQGRWEADYCIIAAGGRNPFKEVGTVWSGRNTMTALGYFVPVCQEQIELEFLEQFAGYIWVFPRNDHLSVGICGKEWSAGQMRARLEQYMRQKEIPLRGATFYGHVLPSLERGEWRSNRVAGEGWLAVGDAAGLVDPVTGEGLYYAIRSADLATDALLAKQDGAAETAATYKARLEEDFLADLEVAARMSHRLYSGQLLHRSVVSRMVQLTRYSPSFRDVMQDLFAGTQDYLTLKRCLLRQRSGVMGETAVNLLRRALSLSLAYD